MRPNIALFVSWLLLSTYILEEVLTKHKKTTFKNQTQITNLEKLQVGAVANYGNDLTKNLHKRNLPISFNIKGEQNKKVPFSKLLWLS